MTTPDYMSHVGEIAREAGDSPNLLAQILGEWRNFEQSAKQRNYDVLDPTFPQEDQMWRLVRLLYQTKTGDAESDVVELHAKDQAYGGSWCRRGGQGAFMMLSRKADRLETITQKHGLDLEAVRVMTDVGGETIADTLSDLRRYLILCLAYRRAQSSEEVRKVF